MVDVLLLSLFRLGKDKKAKSYDGIAPAVIQSRSRIYLVKARCERAR